MHKMSVSNGIKLIVAHEKLQRLLGLWLLCFFGVACQLPPPKPLYIANDVDLAPLLDLVWPEQVASLDQIFDPTLLDPDLFTWNEVRRLYQYDDAGTYLGIYISVLENQETAIKLFGSGCQISGEEPYQSGSGSINDVPYQFCIPYLDIARTGPENLYRTYGKYYYHGLEIQKGNVLISIDERSDNVERESINRAIRLLAAAMIEETDTP